MHNGLTPLTQTPIPLLSDNGVPVMLATCGQGFRALWFKDVTIAYPWVVGVLGGLGSGLWVPTVLRPHLVSRLS